jgi:hypothetical protein
VYFKASAACLTGTDNRILFLGVKPFSTTPLLAGVAVLSFGSHKFIQSTLLNRQHT